MYWIAICSRLVVFLGVANVRLIFWRLVFPPSAQFVWVPPVSWNDNVRKTTTVGSRHFAIFVWLKVSPGRLSQPKKLRGRQHLRSSCPPRLTTSRSIVNGQHSDEYHRNPTETVRSAAQLCSVTLRAKWKLSTCFVACVLGWMFFCFSLSLFIKITQYT